MDELSIQEIINGLNDQNFTEHHLLLVQLLANRFADDQHIQSTDVEATLKYLLSWLNVNSSIFHETELVHFHLVVLANLTLTEANCAFFFSQMSIDVAPFQRLVGAFLGHNAQTEEEPLEESEWTLLDPLQHVASVLCNLTQWEDGRKIILKIGDGYTPKLASQVHLTINNIHKLNDRMLFERFDRNV